MNNETFEKFKEEFLNMGREASEIVAKSFGKGEHLSLKYNETENMKFKIGDKVRLKEPTIEMCKTLPTHVYGKVLFLRDKPLEVKKVEILDGEEVCTIEHKSTDGLKTFEVRVHGCDIEKVEEKHIVEIYQVSPQLQMIKWSDRTVDFHRIEVKE
jgi:hypothetical protein